MCRPLREFGGMNLPSLHLRLKRIFTYHKTIKTLLSYIYLKFIQKSLNLITKIL